MFIRRRCVVCGRHVRRSDWRATRVSEAYEVTPLERALTLKGVAWELLGLPPQRRGVAHRGCVVVSDVALARFVGGPR